MPTRGISPTRLVRTSVLAVSVLVSPGSPGDHDQDTDEHPTEEDGYRAAQPRHRVSEFRDAEHDAADFVDDVGFGVRFGVRVALENELDTVGTDRADVDDAVGDPVA